MIFDGLQNLPSHQKVFRKQTRFFWSCWFCHSTTECKWPPQPAARPLSWTAPVTASATAPVDLTYEKGLDKEGFTRSKWLFANTKNPSKNQQDTHGPYWGWCSSNHLQTLAWRDPGQIHDGVFHVELVARTKWGNCPCKHFHSLQMEPTSVGPLWVRPAPFAQKRKVLEKNWQDCDTMTPWTFQVLSFTMRPSLAVCWKRFGCRNAAHASLSHQCHLLMMTWVWSLPNSSPGQIPCKEATSGGCKMFACFQQWNLSVKVGKRIPRPHARFFSQYFFTNESGKLLPKTFSELSEQIGGPSSTGGGISILHCRELIFQSGPHVYNLHVASMHLYCRWWSLPGPHCCQEALTIGPTPPQPEPQRGCKMQSVPSLFQGTVHFFHCTSH